MREWWGAEEGKRGLESEHGHRTLRRSPSSFASGCCLELPRVFNSGRSVRSGTRELVASRRDYHFANVAFYGPTDGQAVRMCTFFVRLYYMNARCWRCRLLCRSSAARIVHFGHFPFRCFVANRPIFATVASVFARYPNTSQVLLLFDNLRMVRVERADATLPLLPWPPAGLQNSSRTQQPSKGAAFLLLLGAMRAHMLSVTWRALLLVSSANPVSAGFVRRLMRCIEVPRMQVCARAHGWTPARCLLQSILSLLSPLSQSTTTVKRRIRSTSSCLLSGYLFD
jgi:hypothetical protein